MMVYPDISVKNGDRYAVFLKSNGLLNGSLATVSGAFRQAVRTP
jgi:hypothetical protein